MAWDFASRQGNDSIYAALPGEVIRAEVDSFNEGYGNAVVLDHGKGLHTLYAHLNEVKVKTGQVVSLGEEIGTMGRTGRVYGKEPVLHFEVRKEGVKISPESIF